jgi:hypothetical protein
VEARGRELKRQLLQDHLDLRALWEEQALPVGRDRRRVEGRGRIERGHERGLTTVFGPVAVRRLAFRGARAAQYLPGRRRAVAAGGAAQPRAAAPGGVRSGARLL